MTAFRLLLFICITQISSACMPMINRILAQEPDIEPIPPNKILSDMEDTIIGMNSKQYLYHLYGHNRLKNKACHSCPEFKPPDCTIFKEGTRCVPPKVQYFRDGYCMHAEFACNRSFHAVQGRRIDKIRLDGDYADPNEDDTKHETYGVHQLRRMDDKVQRFPVQGYHWANREAVHCMTDKRWYHRTSYPPIITRVDQIYCL